MKTASDTMHLPLILKKTRNIKLLKFQKFPESRDRLNVYKIDEEKETERF